MRYCDPTNDILKFRRNSYIKCVLNTLTIKYSKKFGLKFIKPYLTLKLKAMTKIYKLKQQKFYNRTFFF